MTSGLRWLGRQARWSLPAGVFLGILWPELAHLAREGLRHRVDEPGLVVDRDAGVAAEVREQAVESRGHLLRADDGPAARERGYVDKIERRAVAIGRDCITCIRVPLIAAGICDSLGSCVFEDFDSITPRPARRHAQSHDRPRRPQRAHPHQQLPPKLY